MSTSSQHSSGMWAYGVAVFGGVTLLTVGVFQAIAGLAAILDDKVFVATTDYVFAFDLTTWGWIHLIVGILAVLVGCGILAGQAWGLVSGIVLGVVIAVSAFAFMPYYPFWSITIVALSVAVIWSLSSELGRSTTV